MINLNTDEYSSTNRKKIIHLKKRKETTTYDVEEAAKLFNIKGVGRNKLYEIMREMGLINFLNYPAQNYIDDGVLQGCAAGYLIGNLDRCAAKTIIVGDKGLEFVKSIVLRYLKDPEEATKDVVKPEVEIDYGNSTEM